MIDSQLVHCRALLLTVYICNHFYGQGKTKEKLKWQLGKDGILDVLDFKAIMQEMMNYPRHPIHMDLPKELNVQNINEAIESLHYALSSSQAPDGDKLHNIRKILDDFLAEPYRWGRRKG